MATESKGDWFTSDCEPGPDLVAAELEVEASVRSRVAGEGRPRGMVEWMVAERSRRAATGEVSGRK